MRRTGRMGQAVQDVVGLRSINPIIYNAIGDLCKAYTINAFYKLCGMPPRDYKIPEEYDPTTHIPMGCMDNNWWYDEQKQPKRFLALTRLLKKYDIALLIRPPVPSDYRSRILLLPNPEFVSKVIALVGNQTKCINPRIDRLDGAICLHELPFDDILFFMNNFDKYTIFTEDYNTIDEGNPIRFYAKEKIQDKKRIVMEVLRRDPQIQGHVLSRMGSPLNAIREILDIDESSGIDIDAQRRLLDKIHYSNDTIRREQENIANYEKGLAVCEEFLAGRPSFSDAYYEHLYEWISDNFPTMIGDTNLSKIHKLAVFLAASTI